MADDRGVAGDGKKFMTNFIPYSRQWIDEDDIKAVVEVLRSDWITQGPTIGKFEKALADYCGAKYAVALSSGTAALHAAYYTAGINAGDEVITSPLTFAATANAALYLGARPVFVDIEADTGNINPSLIKKAMTKKTKAIVPVHYSGHPVDMEAVYDLAKRQEVSVIEDACHALGAQYKGEKTGNCKDSVMSIFSFHPVKHIATGEGGAVLTNNVTHYEKLITFRQHGITKKDLKNIPDGDWYYEMQFLGYNYRITDIQAAIGLSQLNKLDRFIDKRRKIAKKYNETFKDNPYFDIPPEKDYACSSYHLYPIRLKDTYKQKKKELFQKLKEKGIGVQVHYIPVYLHPYYQGLGYKKGSCPVAEDYYQREISIPIYPSMTDEDVKYVIDYVSEFLEALG